MGSKITRKTAKIFASDAGGSGVAEFGSTAAGSTVYTTDPAVIQSADFETGLAAGIIAGTKRLPVYEEINGVYLVATQQIAYLLQEGIPEYDSGTEYFINSIVKKPVTYELYGSIGNNNLGNALPSAVSDANWQYLGNFADLANAGGFGTEVTIASATTTDLASGGSKHLVAISGTTTITSFGSNAVTTKPIYIGRFTGALILTHNATSLILPAGANIQTVAGDTFIAQYLGSGNWKVLSYSPISGKAVAPIEELGDWTPVLTFATAGDLAITYTDKLGRYSKIGKRVTLNFKILTSSFTFTTASGQVRITGLPYSSANNNIDSISTLYFGGITKANYTQFVMSLAGNDNVMKGVASGQGFSNLTVTATDIPTGSQVLLSGTITYETP